MSVKASSEKEKSRSVFGVREKFFDGLFPKKKKIPIPEGLNHKERKEVEAVVKKARHHREVPETAQQSIPFEEMYKDGICRVSQNYYTRTIRFQDINYQLAQQEDQSAIFEEWCRFLNFFDSSIHVELCELIVDEKRGLKPIEKTVVDRCVHQIYQKYFADPKPERMPVLQDLYESLMAQEEKEAHDVAVALEIYVKGSLNLFNHHTNTDVNNRLVCYDIKELGKQMKKIGMLIVQDQVWGRVTENRNAGRATRYYIDEFHLLLKEEQTAAYSVEIWKRFRKWGGIPTGITQNVKDFLNSREIANIFENSDFIYMLNQGADDRSILSKHLSISPHQLSYVTHSGEGEGLLFYGDVILPFVDHFPKDLELYRIMSTKPQDLKEAADEQTEVHHAGT